MRDDEHVWPLTGESYVPASKALRFEPPPRRFVAFAGAQKERAFVWRYEPPIGWTEIDRKVAVGMVRFGEAEEAALP